MTLPPFVDLKAFDANGPRNDDAANITARVRKDGGSWIDLSGAASPQGNGIYRVTLTDAERVGEKWAWDGVTSTSGVGVAAVPEHEHEPEPVEQSICLGNVSATDQFVIDAYLSPRNAVGEPCQLGEEIKELVTLDGQRRFIGSDDLFARLEIDPKTGLRAIHKYTGVFFYEGANPLADAGFNGAISFIGSLASDVQTTAGIILSNQSASNPTSETSGVAFSLRANQASGGFGGRDSRVQQSSPNGGARWITTSHTLGRAGGHHNLVTWFSDEDGSGRVGRFFDRNGEIASEDSNEAIGWSPSNGQFVIGGSQYDPGTGEYSNAHEMWITHLGAWGGVGTDPQWAADLAVNLGKTGPQRTILLNADSRGENLIFNGTWNLLSERGIHHEANTGNGWIIPNADARIDALIAGGQKFDAMVYLLLTNHWTTYDDSGAVDTVLELLEEQIQKALAADLCDHVFLCNDTPRSDSASQQVLQYACRRKLEPRFRGNSRVTIIDTWRPVQDPSDPSVFSADYSGDGVHPTTTPLLASGSSEGYMQIMTRVVGVIEEHFAGEVGPATVLNQQSLDSVVIEELEPASLSGPYAVTPMVVDINGPVENATVRMHRTGKSESKLTGTDGNTVEAFAVDAATWTVSITADGFEGQSNQLVVTGDASPIYTLTASSVAGSDAPLTTIPITCWDENGEREEGVTVEMVMTEVPPNSTGQAFDAEVQRGTSDSNGAIELKGVRFATYKIRRGNSAKWHTIVAGGGDVTLAPSWIGQDSS